MSYNERRAIRINYLRDMIALHEKSRDEQIARGVNADWIDGIDAANRDELARHEAEIEREQRPRKPSRYPGRVDVDAEEQRMGRLLRTAARRGEF